MVGKRGFDKPVFKRQLILYSSGLMLGAGLLGCLLRLLSLPRIQLNFLPGPARGVCIVAGQYTGDANVF